MKTLFIVLCIVALCLADKGKESEKEGNNGQGKGSQNGKQNSAPQNGKQNQGGPQNGKSQDGNQGRGGAQNGKSQDGNQGGAQNGKSQDGNQGRGGPQNGQSQDGNQGRGGPQNGKQSQDGNQGRGGPQNGKRGSHEHGGQGGHPKGPWMDPKCNMTNYPKDVDGRQCCPSKPKSFNRENAEACKKECHPAEKSSGNMNRTAMMCCMPQCILKKSGVIAADGSFDEQATIAKLISSTTAPEVWKEVIEKIVKTSIANGPASLEKMKAKMNGSDPCGDALNKVIGFRIVRELFLQCPEDQKNLTNPQCTELFEFAKTCESYPFFGHRHGHGKCDKGKSGENKKGEMGQPTADPAEPQSAKNAADARKSKGSDGAKPAEKPASGAKPAEKSANNAANKGNASPASKQQDNKASNNNSDKNKQAQGPNDKSGQAKKY